MFDVNEILRAASILAGDTKSDKRLVTGKEDSGKDRFLLPVECELVSKNGTIVLDGKSGKSKYE